ncbi:PH domain-containing protein [Micromonospora sp. NPDC048909]|uniref:PH domain-containing protein n=1 Tax=Micromonospora sp. NPDC048909 TaxID=3155643 RepID=UPI0033C4AD3D
MRRWFRMDPWGLRQAVTGLFLVIGTAFAVLLLVAFGRALAGGVELAEALTMVAAAAFMTVWWTFAARLHLAGVYVGERGVRLRHVFRTRTLPWSAVTGFAARPALFLGEPTVRDACWVLTTGDAFETPVQRRSREIGWRKEVGPVLSEADFDRLLDRLDAELADARRRGPGQAGGGVVVR